MKKSPIKYNSTKQISERPQKNDEWMLAPDGARVLVKEWESQWKWNMKGHELTN